MRNIKLIIEYDGAHYHGWQAQPGSDMQTIQETMELAVSRLAGEEIKIHSSGRTDAGVHALGHVVNFMTSSPIPPEGWAPALNRILPPDIRVISSSLAAPDFHSRYSATGKLYRYLIINRPAQSALYRNHAWHVKRPLNIRSMRLAARHLIGRHDFSSFRSADCNAKNPVRTVRKIDIKKRGEFVEIFIEADAFLMHMARNIVGTLVEAGLGRFRPGHVKEILDARDRTQAGRAAPARGLYLVKVFYPEGQ